VTLSRPSEPVGPAAVLAAPSGPRRSPPGRIAFREGEAAFLLRIGDALAAGLGAMVAVSIWASIARSVATPDGLPSPVIASVVIWPLTLRLADGVIFASPRFLRRSMTAIGRASLVITVVLLAVFYLLPELPLREAAILSIPITVPLLVLWRFGYVRLLESHIARTRLAIVGTDDASRRLTQILTTNPVAQIFYELVALVASGRGDVSTEFPGIRSIDVDDSLWSVVDSLDVDQLVIGRTSTIAERLLGDLALCFENGVPVVPATALYEQLTGRVMVASLEADWYADIPTHARGLYGRVKRLADVVIAAGALAVLLPVTAAVGLSILLDSGRPILYRQVRVGRGGNHFVLHKFRSMRVGAELNGAVWATPNDSRATTTGQFLRRSRLDELPQLWDVLVGHMSLIGPRPERPEFTHWLATELPLYGIRTVVRPGISGWAQVQFRYAASLEESLAKLEYDLYYIRHMGPVLDLAIAFRTLGTLLGLRGR
jgi:exopolysaccharide biosynthesis polyprenyl glycosylphosphotransferase